MDSGGFDVIREEKKTQVDMVNKNIQRKSIIVP